jgi:hypothetical protein
MESAGGTRMGGERWEKMSRLDDDGTRSDIGSGGDGNESNEKERVAILTKIEYRQQIGFEARSLRAKTNKREDNDTG